MPASAAPTANSAALELEIRRVEHDFARANLLCRSGAAGMASCNGGLFCRVNLLRVECGILWRSGTNSEGRRTPVVTGIFLTLVLPVTFQILEYLLHWFRGTPHLRFAGIVSLVVSGTSALFNWYAMRRGTLLVGRGAGGFGGDLRRLPRLLLGFLAVLPRKIAGSKIAASRTAGKSQSRPKAKVRIMAGSLVDEK